MLSFFAAVIASSTALWIAYRVYPIQKKKDRQLKLQEEKASVYRAFFDAATVYQEAANRGFKHNNLGYLDAEYDALLKAQAALMLYAPGNVVSDCKACTEALFEYWWQVRAEQGKPPPQQKLNSANRGHAYHRAREARDKALVTVRVDLWDCSLQDARTAVAGLNPSEAADDIASS